MNLEVIDNNKYKENAMKLSKSFHRAGASKKAVDAILNIMDATKISD